MGTELVPWQWGAAVSLDTVIGPWALADQFLARLNVCADSTYFPRSRQVWANSGVKLALLVDC